LVVLEHWSPALVVGLMVMLAGLLAPPTSPSGASVTPEVIAHQSAALRVHLVLLAGRIISAGVSTSAFVVIDNPTNGPIAVTQGCGGKPQVAAVLSNSKVPQFAAFATLKCADVELTPGLHRYPVQIAGTYQGCIEPGGSGVGLPQCLGEPVDGLPPLPVGRYHAVIDTDSSLPSSTPVPMTVIPPRPNPTAYRSAQVATTWTVPALKSLEKSEADEARLNGDTTVHHGYIILTTRQRAAAPDIVNSDQPVYLVVLQGRFVCVGCSIPPGAEIPSGSVITSSLDRQSLKGLDFGITRSLPTVLVGEPIYRFAF
jgi:hypothetical protein